MAPHKIYKSVGSAFLQRCILCAVLLTIYFCNGLLCAVFLTIYFCNGLFCAQCFLLFIWTLTIYFCIFN